GQLPTCSSNLLAYLCRFSALASWKLLFWRLCFTPAGLIVLKYPLTKSFWLTCNVAIVKVHIVIFSYHNVKFDV
ncbi:MAG: hypothetical protein ACR2PB_14895, partial [Desulfocapsaceae bacterium]